MASTAIAGSPNHRQEFCPRARIGAEVAKKLARDHGHAVLAHAARGHALVDSFDDDADAARLQHVLDAVRDLRRQRFLHLQPACERLDDTRQLADADDLAIRKVTDVHSADDRRHVMLAVRLEAYVAQHDHLVVAFDLAEGAPQELERVVFVAAEPILVSTNDASWSAQETFAVRVVADPFEQRPDGSFCFRTRGFAFFGLGLGSSLAGRHLGSSRWRSGRQSKSRLLDGATERTGWHIDAAAIRSSNCANIAETLHGSTPSSSIV